MIPGDVAMLATKAGVPDWLVPARSVVRPADADLDRLAALLNDAGRVTLLCGAGCAGAHDEVVTLARLLKAPVVHALRGKEFIEYDNPYDVGLTGLLGFSSGYAAMMSCDTLLMLGTDFPYRQFYPEHARIAQVDIRPEALGNRCPLAVGLVGDVADTLRALMPRLREQPDTTHVDKAVAHYRKTRASLDELAESKPDGAIVHPQYLTRLVDELAADDAIFTCDVGTPTAWAAALPPDERQAAPAGLVQPRLDGQRHAAGDRRPGDLPGAPGRVALGRWWLHDDAG